MLSAFAAQFSKAPLVYTPVLTRLQATVRGMSTQLKVVNDSASNTLIINISGSHQATIDYEKEGKVLDLIETTVPENLRGKGYGRKIAKAAFDYIKDNNLKMKLTCGFLQKVYEENQSTYKKYIVN